MSECMICQVRRAEHPFLIDCVGLRVWSVEELLYFMQHNLVLLDETILNADLVRWIKEELHMRRAALGLGMLLQKNFSVRSFIMPLFEEIRYPSSEAISALDRELKELDRIPLPMRIRKKGDALASHEKYVAAIEAYEMALEKQKESAQGTGQQFTGMILGSIGSTCARLFRMDEACEYLKKSCELLRSDESCRKYLYAVYLRDGAETVRREASELGMRGALVEEVLEKAGSLAPPAGPADTDEALRTWVRAYHVQTGA